MSKNCQIIFALSIFTLLSSCMLAKEIQDENLSQGKECNSNADCKESEACP